MNGPSAFGLVDRFGRRHTTLRISVTERCNLRCRYCMPAEGVELLPRAAVLSFEEVERLAALFVRLGIRRIRLTGGEPLVRRDVVGLATRLGRLKTALPAAFGPLSPPTSEGGPSEPLEPRLARLLLTTNGLLLEPLLPALQAAGVDAINVSIDTLRPDRYEALALRPGLAVALSAIDAACRAGFRVKVNAVALRGVNDDELVALARRFAGERGLEMRYLEYMPFDGNQWSDAKLLPASEIRALLEREFELEPWCSGRPGENGGTATVYRLRDRTRPGRPSLPGTVGVIATITEPFCGDCSRLRLTADGHLRWCLLDEGEVDLAEPLRSGATDGDLAGLVAQGLARKAQGHAETRELVRLQASNPARAMVRIGG